MKTLYQQYDTEICADCQLLMAVAQDDIDEVIKALEEGACINLQNHNENPLIKAVLCNSHKTVEYLLYIGADPNLEDDNELMAIDYASNWKMVVSLLTNGSKPSFKSGRLNLYEYGKVLKYLCDNGLCDYLQTEIPKHGDMDSQMPKTLRVNK